METRDEIVILAAALKDNQDRLLSCTRSLELIIESISAGRAAGQAHGNGSLELNAAAQIMQLNTANAELKKQAEYLARRNHEITLLSRMNDFLQTSATGAEAYSIIAETVAQMFPDDSGAVFVLSASRNMLEAAAVWGPLAPAQLIFPPGECWALRRGQAHLSIGHEQCCSHVTDNGHMSACRCWRRVRRWASCICLTAWSKAILRKKDAWQRSAYWRKRWPTTSGWVSPT